jgi:hypothetical protein
MAILSLGLPLLVKDDCHLSGINRLQAFAQLHGGSADGHVSAHVRSCAKRSATRSGQNPKKTDSSQGWAGQARKGLLACTRSIATVTNPGLVFHRAVSS